MKNWLILLLVALLSFPIVTLAGQPKLRGPSRSLSSRQRISSMKDRGKPHVQVGTRKKANRPSLSRNRPVESIIYEDHYYRPPQPIIVIVHVLPTPIPEPKPRPAIVRAQTHVTIFAPNQKRFDTSRGGVIIFPEKTGDKTKP